MKPIPNKRKKETLMMFLSLLFVKMLYQFVVLREYDGRMEFFSLLEVHLCK